MRVRRRGGIRRDTGKKIVDHTLRLHKKRVAVIREHEKEVEEMKRRRDSYPKGSSEFMFWDSQVNEYLGDLAELKTHALEEFEEL